MRTGEVFKAWITFMTISNFYTGTAMSSTEEQSQVIFDNAHDIFFVVNIEPEGQFRFVTVNPRFESVTGLQSDQVIGKLIQDVIPEPSCVLVLEKYKEAVKAKKSVQWEEASIYPAGLKVGEVSITPVFDANKNCIQLIGIVLDITKRKQAEEELRLTQFVSDHAPDSIFWIDKQARIVYVNAAACHERGYTKDELLAMSIPDIDPNFTVDVWTRHWQELKQKNNLTFETRHRRRDGAILPIEVSANYVKFDGKEFNVAFARDITERKLAEEKLKEQSLRNRLILQATQDGFWLVGRDGRLREVNNAYCQMSGYSTDELMTMRVCDVEGKESSAEIQLHIKKILATGFDCFETRHRRKDGSVLEVEVSAALLGKSDDCDIFAFLRDITVRKRAEETLRVAATAFETHESIMITDANGTIIRVNQAFQEMSGYGSEEAVGKNPRILSSGLHGVEFYAGMWQQLTSTGKWTGEIWDKRKSGQIFPKWLTITSVKDEKGQVTEYVAISSDITSRKQADEEIRTLAFYDALTGLPNRRLLMDRLHSALSNSARSHLYGAVLFLDMDNFKIINDTLGHDYGDLLLIEVSSRIKLCVREIDSLARLGGDEFVVLIEELDEYAEVASQKVTLIAEKIRAVLAAPYEIKGNVQMSSPSIGVCLYRGYEESVESLLKHADMAMYQAKDSGRNTVRFFDPAMQTAVESRAALEADLRCTVPDQQLRLYYQVQVDNDQRPIGAEALVRWIHPVRGMVSPAQFIPIAEESSLILGIGEWVMDTACRQLAAWAKFEQTKHLTLAVNVSARQFKQPDIVEKVKSLLQTYSLDASRLKIELTESVVLNDVTDVIFKMHELKALGIKLSMDDFGTGYSSLSYLKQLPLDQLKIDQSFVRDMTSDQNDVVMVQTIIDMAKNFRLNVIAEGVETEAQLTLLKKMGCMAYQGYFFSKPVPIEEFEALLIKV
jgi:diguanylate cyclase (GGDEF)-like protein/PAS domain S-box-containing protein